MAHRVVGDQRADAIGTRRRVAQVAAQTRTRLNLNSSDHLHSVDDAGECIAYLLVFVDLIARHRRTNRHTPIWIVADLRQLRDVLDIDYRVEVPSISPRLYQYVSPACDRARTVAMLVKQSDCFIDRPGSLICKGMQNPLLLACVALSANAAKTT